MDLNSEFVHTGDAHIYLNHLDQVVATIKRTKKLPKMVIKESKINR